MQTGRTRAVVRCLRWLARRFLIGRSFAVLPDKLLQSFWVGLGPDRAARKASVAHWLEFRAMVQGDSEKTESFRSEYDVREIFITGPRDLPFRDLRPSAFEALGHSVRLTFPTSELAPVVEATTG